MNIRTAQTRVSELGAVFYISVVISVLFVLWGALFTDNLTTVGDAVLDYVIKTFGWVYILATLGFLIFVLSLAFSRYGRITLGRDGEVPEFHGASWVAMMFSAGMGIGLMFYGVYEPISHFANPPFGLATAETPHAAQVAMQYAFFHWGLHAWGIFAVVGLALAYSTFRKGRSGLISPVFYPLLGERINGPIGKAIDILAIFATLFGSATSLGLGTLQITTGLSTVFGLPDAISLQLIIIAVMTSLFTLSAVSGIHNGIQWLSNTNMVLALVLFLFMLFVGPTVFLIDFFSDSLGHYLGNFLVMSFRSNAFTDSTWLQQWTLFYWAWWISWAPFVGTFIARISRGRTIREFVLAVLLVPSVISFLWFAILGGSAIDLQLTHKANIVASALTSQSAALFDTLYALPFPAVTSLISIVLVSLFFISGADASAIVMGMLSSKGSLKPRTPILILWGALTGLAAGVLLMANGLAALQNAAIIAAVPFTIVMILLCYALLKDLRSENPRFASSQRAV